MSRLILVRHGRAESAWDVHADPGLDDTGRGQARSMAEALAAAGLRDLVVSPRRRTIETAAFLEAALDLKAVIDPAVGEIPTPVGLAELSERGPWLAELFSGGWGDVDDPVLRAWREGVVEALRAMVTDTVVVSHFVAINVAVGHATEDDRLVCFRPDNCSRTILENDQGQLRVIELGREAETQVG
ncbi:MAG: histidine phosphatase family protein [Acidimicrobiales bacterium]